MKKMLLAMVSAIGVFLVSCDKNIKVPVCAGLGDSTVVRVKYGEKKSLCDNDSSCFSFTKLISDSRCPADAECVWKGTAVIELSTCNEKEGAITLEIYHPVDYKINDVNYTIELTGLDPYPSTSYPHDVSEYVATVTVKRK